MYLRRQMLHKSEYLQQSEFPVYLHKREAVTTVYQIHTVEIYRNQSLPQVLILHFQVLFLHGFLGHLPIHSN